MTLPQALNSAFPQYPESAHRKAASRMEQNMTAQHTPGPWGVSAQPHGYSVWNVVDDEINPACIGRPVANVVGGYDSVQIEEANARLIAAAPELLKALEACVSWSRGAPETDDFGKISWDVLKTAEQAIAKVYGTTKGN